MPQNVKKQHTHRHDDDDESEGMECESQIKGTRVVFSLLLSDIT